LQLVRTFAHKGNFTHANTTTITSLSRFRAFLIIIRFLKGTTVCILEALQLEALQPHRCYF
jgi:hypothetical protein